MVNQLTIVMVKCGVLFEVRTEFLNIIYLTFSFRWLMALGKLYKISPERMRKLYITSGPGM
jgi:hypothetical protein